MHFDPVRPPPVGLQLFVLFVASLAGLGTGLLVNQWGATLTLLTVGVTCLALFLIARISADSEWTGVRQLVLLGAWAFGWAMMLAGLGEVVRPRRVSRDLAGLLGTVFRVFGVLVVAVAAPSIAIAAGFRRAATTGDAPVAASPPAGATIQLVLSVAAFVVTMMMLALTFLIRDAVWRSAVMVAFVLVWPAAMLPLSALAYRASLARRHVTPPGALVDGLETTRARTGVSFPRVLCLDSADGAGRVCMVISVPRCPTLAISAALVETLSPSQFLAVLAHEAAHVRFRHAARKLAWATVLTLLTIAVGTVLLYVITPLFSRSFRLLANLLALFPLLVGRGLYEALVTRRHEAEADRFAVQMHGADALLGALEIIQGQIADPTGATVHHRWTTHGTWERRAARIRQFDAQAPSAPAPAE